MDDEVKVYTWGYNEHGELGNGTNIEYSNEPICISEIEENALNGKKIVEVQNYYGATILAIDSEGKAYTWGMNLYDQLGNGANIEYSNVPICITDNKKLELYGRKIKKKFMYMLQNCGVQLYLTQEGELYAYSYFWPV